MLEPALTGLEVKSLALYAMLSLILFLVSIVAFFVARVFNKVDEMWDKVKSMEILLGTFKDDVGYVRHTKYDMKEKFEDITILKRDQLSIWKRIDELKAQMGAGH